MRANKSTLVVVLVFGLFVALGETAQATLYTNLVYQNDFNNFTDVTKDVQYGGTDANFVISSEHSFDGTSLKLIDGINDGCPTAYITPFGTGLTLPDQKATVVYRVYAEGTEGDNCSFEIGSNPASSWVATGQGWSPVGKAAYNTSAGTWQHTAADFSGGKWVTFAWTIDGDAQTADLFYNANGTTISESDLLVSGALLNGDWSEIVKMKFWPSWDNVAQPVFLDKVQVFVPVPEPSSVMLLAFGVTSLLAYAWRKRK